MADLFAEGFGPDVELDRERVGITWAQFGHLYEPFYVYQYATGISGAHALARRVLDGEAGCCRALSRVPRGRRLGRPARRAAGRRRRPRLARAGRADVCRALLARRPHRRALAGVTERPVPGRRRSARAAAAGRGVGVRAPAAPSGRPVRRSDRHRRARAGRPLPGDPGGRPPWVPGDRYRPRAADARPDRYLARDGRTHRGVGVAGHRSQPRQRRARADGGRRGQIGRRDGGRGWAARPRGRRVPSW